MGLTNDRSDPELHETHASGQNKKYLVLSEEERAKGFVRPVRRSYVHVGIPGPKYGLRDLTDKEKAMFEAEKYGYVKYEGYPEGSRGKGRLWTQAQLDKVNEGCGSLTTMAQAIAETYAREPAFYGATFCCVCGKHLPVGEHGEFVWDGTDERVGT